MSGYELFPYAAKFKRGWRAGFYYGGDTRADADRKAIQRLQYLAAGQVFAIRRNDTKEIVWRKEKPVARPEP